MRDKQLYQQIFGIRPPWRVIAVDVAMEDSELTVRVEASAGTQQRCPQCLSALTTISGLQRQGYALTPL